MSHHMCVNCLMCAMAQKHKKRSRKPKETHTVFVDESAPGYLGNLPLDDILSQIGEKCVNKRKSKRQKSKDKDKTVILENYHAKAMENVQEINLKPCCVTSDCEFNPRNSDATNMDCSREDALYKDDRGFSLKEQTDTTKTGAEENIDCTWPSENEKLDLNSVIEKANILLHDIKKDLEYSLDNSQNRKSQTSRRKRTRMKSNEMKEHAVGEPSVGKQSIEEDAPEVSSEPVADNAGNDNKDIEKRCGNIVQSPEYYIYAKVLRFNETDREKESDSPSSSSETIGKTRIRQNSEPIKIDEELRDSIKEHLKKSFIDYFRRQEERKRVKKRCATDLHQEMYGRATEVDYSMFEAGTSSSFSDTVQTPVYNY